VHAATGGCSPDRNKQGIILIHGAGMDRTAWQLQTRNLAHNGFSAYAIDLPGHGRSEGPPLKTIPEMAEWIGRYMLSLETEPMIVMGHSMGALIALEVAAQFSKLTNKLILIGVADSMPVHPDLLDAANRNLPLAPELIVFWGLCTPMQVGGHLQPGYWIKGASQNLLRISRSGVLGIDLTACNNYQNGLEAAKQVSSPVKIILGADDKMTPTKKGIFLSQSLKNVAVDVIPECGHMIMIERPEHVYHSLKRFISPG